VPGLDDDAPETREVRGDLKVSFGGALYWVKDVPHLNIGQKVMVARSPYRDDAILLIEQDEHQRDVHWVCPAVAIDAAGFDADAPVWGEEFKALADTPAVQRHEGDRRTRLRRQRQAGSRCRAPSPRAGARRPGHHRPPGRSNAGQLHAAPRCRIRGGRRRYAPAARRTR
jgi:hypothetical protein